MSTFSATLTGPRVPSPGLPPGLRIGPYEIEREIGRGGMGAVYLAFRADEAYEKKVAVKVTPAALPSAAAVERFLRERRILARLEHPNIARLIDGGATAEGTPYLVMEYIEGQPLHAWCDANRLSTVERLRLFLAVCAAVEYAHRQLVIHRDLKPANILVTADGAPHLLDFGIAKLLDPDAGRDAAAATAVALTPWYASPEQVRGEPLSTATDVYSLGVLLYEVLTGHSPYRVTARNPLEVLRAVVEQEPERPSSAAQRTERLPATEGGSSPTLTPWSVSLAREGTPQRLRSRLRGDLDAILLTALRKDPGQRYPSVAAFATDVEAYLEGRPVAARAQGVFYRTSKFLRRHRWGVAAAALILALVTGGIANVVVQSRRVARERDRAARIQRFLVDLFGVSDPGEARGSTITAREVLDRGAERIRHDLAAEPEARADLMEAIADVYNRLGLNDSAASLAREALAFRREVGSRDPQALARTLNLLGSILMDKGDAAGAEAPYRESLAIRRRVFGDGSIEVAQALNNLGGILDTLGRYDESDRLQGESLEIKRRLLGPDDPSLATSLYNLGVSLYRRGDVAGAGERLSEALAINRRAYGDDHPEVAFMMQSLGVIEDDSGRYEEAERHYRDALAVQKRILGEEHPDIVTTLTNLGNTLNHQGRLEDAEATLWEALSMSRKVYGDEVVDTAHVLAGLADVELQRGDLASAEKNGRTALAVRERVAGADHPDTAEARVLLGRVLLAEGRHAEAELALRLGLAQLEARSGPEGPQEAAREALARLERAAAQSSRTTATP